MYCQRKGWRLDSISAKYEHNKVHADDCDDCDDADKGYIDRVTSEIFIEGDFDDEDDEDDDLSDVIRGQVEAHLVGQLEHRFRSVHAGGASGAPGPCNDPVGTV